MSICVLSVSTSRPARQLVAELAIDVRQHAVEAVDARFHLLHELQARRHAVELAVQLAGMLAEPGGFLGAFFDQSELRLDGVHLGFDFRRARVQRADPLDESFQRRPIRSELVAQRGGFGVGLVELHDLLAERFEVAPALVERHQL